MAANRARAVLFGLVLALCAVVSPADASLPDPYGLAGDDLAAEHVLELLRETAAAAPTLPEPAAAPAFTLWPEPPPPDGHLFARTPEPPLLEPAVRGLRTALEEAASLPETRIRAFGLFEPHLRLGRGRASRENATGYGLGLRETYVGPTQKGLWTDPVTGMAYARARWYDPRNASWLSEDPLLDIDSPNLYAFVAWQPTMGTDPMGTCFGGLKCRDLLGVVGGTFRGAAEDVADFFTRPFRDTGEAAEETAASARRADRTLRANMGNRDPVIDALLAEDYEGLELPSRLHQQELRELGESARAIGETAGHAGRTAGHALNAADRYLLGNGLYKIAVVGGRRVVVSKSLDEVLDEGAARGVAGSATPDRFEGVRELSRILRQAGVPKSDRLQVVNSFRNGEIILRRATGNENVIRYFGGDAGRVGRFVTEGFPQGDARRLLALPPENAATELTQFRLREGAVFFEGTVGSNFGLPGGGRQIFVPNLDDLVPVQ